jgi:type II secretory ATPase GspE/PulE/Tfp pilus assembly ATPase PilB-like protein
MPAGTPTKASPVVRDTVEEILARPDLSIIDLVAALIERAHARRASDIHIDPSRDDMRVRLRVDGVLTDAYRLPKTIHGEIVSRIKVLAGMRTDEHQATQDGRFRHTFSDGETLDLRVSIAPTYHGENVVMRILSDKAADYTLEMLGFSESDIKHIEAAIKRPNGMILATGPTGSGKTTTLYTLVKMLNTPEVSIVTIEDPIEYSVEQIEQIQVNPRAGLTFATGLRSILRQDPNIIMVGEIRDAETASIAVNTALTGHLLLSTLHTNDAASTLPRLLDMGIDAYLVSSTINVALAQRLVRKICVHCKHQVIASKSVEETLASVPLTTPVKEGDAFFLGKGCIECGGTGYAGRIAISEVLIADAKIRDAILRKASAAELRKIAIKNGMTTMLEDGFTKARAGLTSVEEILRVVHE